MKKTVQDLLNHLYSYEKESDCNKRRVVAILYDNRDRAELAYGINKTVLPYNRKNCVACKTTPSKEGLELCPAIHAEADCLLKLSQSMKKFAMTLLVSYSPCPECCKLIANSPFIKTVIVAERRLKPAPLEDRLAYEITTYDELAQKLLKDKVNYICLEDYEATKEVF